MTCIVGIVDGDTIHIGGDSLGSDPVSDHVVGRADEKVFVSDTGEFIFGFSGAFRVGQLLRYAFTPPDVPSKKEDIAYMVTDFVDAWRGVQKDKGTLKKVEDEESHSCSFLVGYNGKLYAIEEDFDVGVPQDDYYAVGSGSQFAFGSLHSTKGVIRDPKKRIIMALEAATAYCAAVRPPFTILSLKKGE